MRPALEVIIGQTPRAALIGTAGSGKSAGLRRLHELFTEDSSDALLLHAGSGEIPVVPPEQVLLVDDVHLLTEAQLRNLGERAENPAAALIVARRPWPAQPALRALSRQMERNAAAIVLGHVTRADVLDHLETLQRRLPDACIEHILRSTSGIAWLVSAAVQHHDSRDCAHEGTHASLDRVLGELVVHRLDTVDDALRCAIEEMCIAAPGDRRAVTASHSDSDPDSEGWIMQGWAQGLLLRSGDPAPLVCTTVRQSLPTKRLIDLCTRFPEALRSPEGLRPLREPRLASAIVANADRMLRTHPAQAADMYAAAIACGAPPQDLAPRRAEAAWSAGDLEAAASVLEDTLAAASGSPPDAAVTAIAAATWSARGMMGQAHRVYQVTPPSDAVAYANATIAALGSGQRSPSGAPAQDALPSARTVSMALLRTGLRATIGSDASESALPDLIRSAEMYTAAQRSEALCELPAVLAAVVALNLGRLATAQSVLDDAIEHGHGGEWARPRLLLWCAWVAVQRAHPVEARSLLRRALAFGRGRLQARDALLMHAVRVAIARRYEDSSGLEAAWHEARAGLLRADIDLYLLHPLTELVSAATRAGDAERIEPHLRAALQIIASLDSPPLWAAHVHWAGIQQGILLSRPDLLAPHAKALVTAAPHNRVAAGMAKAGRVWTEVLAGSVDPDAVVAAAEALAAVGLMWDAARLAGHGAARTTDRRVAGQLLACARELHPTDGTRRPTTTSTDDVESTVRTAPGEVLSEREIEVARLVLQGKTYAEIGEAIFISPRTAEHHIAHIRRRLGATSRSEVLARLRLLLGENSASAGRMAEPP
ncbi:LuxR C-terminal-related transcriptional regulator [Microbacterium sp. NPDC089318]